MMKIIFLIVALCAASTLAAPDKPILRIQHCLTEVHWTQDQLKTQCQSDPPPEELDNAPDTPFEKLLTCIFTSSKIVELVEVDDEVEGIIHESVVRPHNAINLVSGPLTPKLEKLLQDCKQFVERVAGCTHSASVFLNRCLYEKKKDDAIAICLAMTEEVYSEDKNASGTSSYGSSVRLSQNA